MGTGEVENGAYRSERKIQQKSNERRKENCRWLLNEMNKMDKKKGEEERED